MASEIRKFTAVIPAGTPSTAPVTVAMGFPARKVERIEVTVPSGCNGVVGFYLASSGVQVIPYEPGTWLVESGESFGWDLTGLPDSGDWSLVGYNNGNYDHAIQVRFVVALPVDPYSNQIGTPVSVATLNGE